MLWGVLNQLLENISATNIDPFSLRWTDCIRNIRLNVIDHKSTSAFDNSFWHLLHKYIEKTNLFQFLENEYPIEQIENIKV